MKKRLFSLILVLSMLIVSISFAQSASAASPEIKNIIYLIPDGGGYSPYDLASMVKEAGGFTGFPNKTPVTTGPLALKSHLVGSAKTAPYGGGVTDSAAAGTALATGKKTQNGRIGLDHNAKPIANLVEAAQSVGKSTGLIATYEWMHATPAAFSAHAMDRNDYATLYTQIENKGIDVVLGAGYGAVSSYATIQNAKDRGYNIMTTKSDLAAVKPGDKLWGNAANPNFPYDYQLSSTQPTLAEMTQAAITALSDNENGFFLMVEGSKVDTGGHANDALATTSEFLAFDAAFKVAVDFAKGRTDTVVVATPDHDTGGMILKDNLTNEVNQIRNGSDPSTISWTSGNHTGQHVGIWMYVPEGISVINGLNSTLGDTPETRTGYVVENTAIAPYVASLMGVDLTALTEELFVNVTSIGTYKDSSGKFTFNSGKKAVYKNESVYYLDGVEKSMDHKEMIVVNDKVYLPASIIDEEDWTYVGSGGNILKGTGAKGDPYLIEDAEDFVTFTENVREGTTYTGKYFNQTAHINLAGNKDYTGMGKAYTFGGIYDGCGYTINIDLKTSGDECVFPYITGTVMNLGTTGNITRPGSNFSSGIARSIREGGKLINCYSTVDINGYDVRGLVGSNYGIISNCYFGGTVQASSQSYALGYLDPTGKYENCYYISGKGTSQSETGITAVTQNTAETTLVQSLNDGRAAAATASGISEGSICLWEKDTNNLPRLILAVPTVTNVKVTPETATVNKGEGYQFTATVEGMYEPSQKVKWSIESQVSSPDTYIADDGYLVVSPDETASSITILAKSAMDGGKAASATVTVGSTVISEPDGTRPRPYLIEDEADFLEFTNAILGGTKYEGKYFKQTADLDMAGYTGYNGMGANGIFGGIYDGNGYVINISISGTDNNVFPYTTGTVMNLGTTGTINNTSYSSGICRSLREGGKMVNCWSNVTVNSTHSAGVVWSNYGTIANCYFSGVLNGSTQTYPIAQPKDNGVTKNCYYLGTEFYEDNGVTEISEEQFTTSLLGWLNTNKDDSADFTDLLPSSLMAWVNIPGSGPRLRTPKTTAALADVAYSNGSVTGEFTMDTCSIDTNAYVALFEDGNLVTAKQISVPAYTTEDTFELEYSVSQSKEYTVVLYIWDSLLKPLSVVDNATVSK